MDGFGGFGEPPVQRTLEGPRAEEVWTARFAQAYGRIPTFNERLSWKEAFDEKVGAWLSRHPDITTSPRASQFRFQRRVLVGMTKEEVLLLLEPPENATTDEVVMSADARTFWPSIKPRATEMWAYPGGWRLYFGQDRLVDMTVTGRRSLE
jgi:hypothetical protein